ncbi:putative E3 ubiquitin-protein ligase HIP1 [Canna indica]|uniref:E3 ubiquitin-protein ligase HIP1 n=1 Tax=Canna indica TaxID=4628 RepID=A0AAQ3KX52_9LILI|nr:putative E3 ubiquitin-protein ligase HIP1 [Canna indica]
MPLQRSFVQPLHDSFEFDHGSSSSNSSMNQQVLWNNMLFNPAEVESMTDRIVSSSDANMPCLNVSNQDGGQLSIWGSSGSSPSQHYQQDGHEENKWEYGWTPSGTSTSRTGPRIEENHSEGSHMLSLDNHNTTQIDGSQSFPQNNLLFNNLHNNTEHGAAGVGMGNELSDSRFSHHSYALGFLDPESVPSIDLSIPSESSENVGLLREDDERPESSLDGRRISCKRKNSEGFCGQSSTSANASSSHQRGNSLLHSPSYNPMTSLNISSSSGYPSVAHSSEEVPAGFGTTVRGMASECYPSASTTGNAESSHRNYRMRTNPALAQPNSWPVNTVRQSDIWLPNQLPSRTISLNHSLDPSLLATSTSQNQPHIQGVPGLPHIIYHFPWHGASSSRMGSSSGSFNLEGRAVVARGGSQSRNVPTTSNIDLVPAATIRNMAQDQANWNLGSRNINMVPNSQTGTNSGIHPTLGSSWVPRQAPTQYPQPLAEATHPSLFPSVSPESGGQAANFPRHSGHSFSSQEVARQIRATLRGPQPTSQVRSANLMRRRNDGILGAPLSMRSLTVLGEERSRMLSEIRHALESLRRGDGLRFEVSIEQLRLPDQN